ncbi:MAG: hydroxyethylthiazole kinase [Fusicatenibacter sp.]|nr:hydroxyethylthiazole kinase [Fusicatenibacter sp.]
MQDLMEQFRNARAAVQRQSPLIHSITSPIAINDCANAVLALGAKPIMAEHPSEVAKIAQMADALTVSLANITDARAQSILIAGREKAGVIDLVGINCSDLRMNLARTFIRECHPAVIKGNASEIRAIAGADFDARGIDVGKNDAVTQSNPDSLSRMAKIMKPYAARTGAVILASGEVDLIAAPDGQTLYAVQNGTSALSKVTGTGCMLTCITGVYLSVSDPLTASLLAAVTLGIAGEITDDSHGLGTYHIGLIDSLSLMDDKLLAKRMKLSLLPV